MAESTLAADSFEWYAMSDPARLTDRVPKWASGADTWQAIFAEGVPADIAALAPLTRKRMATTQRSRRLFVSHRQTSRDTARAKQLADMAKAAGLPVWVDVLDPTLAQLGSSSVQLSDRQLSVAVAAVIEVALLNCTHAVALLSSSSRGSMWIPYEYGRIKQGGLSSNVACFVSAGTPSTSIPEYACLATLIHSMRPMEQEFSAWISRHAVAAHAACL